MNIITENIFAAQSGGEGSDFYIFEAQTVKEGKPYGHKNYMYYAPTKTNCQFRKENSKDHDWNYSWKIRPATAIEKQWFADCVIYSGAVECPKEVKQPILFPIF